MESNGERGQIQMSEATAELLMAAGKSHWLKKREDLIEAKGKGSMQVKPSTTTILLMSTTHTAFSLFLTFSSSLFMARKCYWLDIKASSGSVAEFESSVEDEESDEESLDGEAVFAAEEQRLSRKHTRLVDWNTECLFQLLKQIAVSRKSVVQDDPAFLTELDKVKEQLREYVRNIALV